MVKVMVADQDALHVCKRAAVCLQAGHGGPAAVDYDIFPADLHPLAGSAAAGVGPGGNRTAGVKKMGRFETQGC